MAINLDAAKNVCLDDAVTAQELNAVVDTSAYKRMGESIDETVVEKKVSRSKKKGLDSKSVIYAANNKNKQAKVRKKKAQKAREKQETESREQAARNAKTRKYTKEMRNRDAIIKKSRSMRNKAAKTESTYDDKFAVAATAPTKCFDNIIYNSPTADDAEELLEDVFEAVMDDVD